jgi:hypothetical protein
MNKRSLAVKSKKLITKKPRKSRVIEATGYSTGQHLTLPPVSRFRETKVTAWDSNVYLFTTTTSAGGNVAAYNFSLSNLPDTSIFGDFEAYRIDQIDIVAKPTNNAGYSGASTNAVAYWTAYDPDDSATTLITGVAAKQTARVHGFSESWEESIVPLASPAVFNGSSAFSGYELPTKPIWIDSAVLSVPHFGFKLAAPQFLAATSIQLLFRYHISLRLNQ